MSKVFPSCPACEGALREAPQPRHARQGCLPPGWRTGRHRQARRSPRLPHCPKRRCLSCRGPRCCEDIHALAALSLKPTNRRKGWAAGLRQSPQRAYPGGGWDLDGRLLGLPTSVAHSCSGSSPHARCSPVASRNANNSLCSSNSPRCTVAKTARVTEAAMFARRSGKAAAEGAVSTQRLKRRATCASEV